MGGTYISGATSKWMGGTYISAAFESHEAVLGADSRASAPIARGVRLIFEYAIEFGAGNSLVLIRELEVWQSVSLLPERSGRSLYYRGKTVIGHDPAQLFAGDISVWVIGVIKWTCRVREKVSPSGSYFASELIYPQAARGLATDIHLPASRQRTGDRHFGHGPNQALELDLGEVA